MVSLTERSPPGSDGRFSSLPSKASVVEPPESSAAPRDDAEPDHRLGQLEVRQADAVARPAPVDRHHHDLAVLALADTGARVSRGDLRRDEVLARRVDGLAVADDDGAAAEGIGDPGRRPVGSEDELDVDACPRRRLGLELRRLRAVCDQHRPVLRNRRAAARRLGRDRAGEQAASRGGRERLEHRLDRARKRGCRRAPRRSEDRGPVARRSPVHGERPAAAETLPVAVERDPRDAQRAGRGDADAGAILVGRALDHVVVHHDPGRMAVFEVEEVAVDAGDRRGRRDRLLHRGHPRETGDRAVGQDRLQRVEPARARPDQDVEHDRPVRGELHLARVGHAGHQRLRRRRQSGRGEDCG